MLSIMSEKPDAASEQAAIDEVVDRLIAKRPTVNQAYIRELVQREYETLQTAKLRDYIPVLVEHMVKQDLKDEKSKRDANLI